MEQWNSEGISIEAKIERIREANRHKNVSLNKITYLAFITKYAPYSEKQIYEEEQPDGSTKVRVEWENVLSSKIEYKSLPKAVEIITASHAGKEIEEFEAFNTTSKRRIKRFLDALLGQKDCVKLFFTDGFSQLQANDLIYILLHWESVGFQNFCDGKYEELCEPIPYSPQDFENYSVFENDIVDYVYDFIVGGLEDQINLQELSDLWHQRLEVYKEAKKQRLKKQVYSELDNVKNLISACIDPRPEAKDMDAQLKFLSRCLRLIGALEEKIIKRSSYMKRMIAEENDKFWIELYQQIKNN